MTAAATKLDGLFGPLDRVRRQLRRALGLETILMALRAALVLVGLLWLLDRELFLLTGFDWVLDAPRWLRLVAVAGLALGLVAWVFYRLFGTNSQWATNQAVALALEKRYPEVLGERLITAIELQDIEQARRWGYSPRMIEQTLTEAQNRLSQLEPLRLVQPVRFRRLLLSLLVLVGFGGCWVLVREALVLQSLAPQKVFYSAVDQGLTFAERQVLGQQSPWPRSGYVEVLEPIRIQERIGREGASPTVRARAYRWLLADAEAPFGWRPLRWREAFASLGQPQAPLLHAPRPQTFSPEWLAQATVTGATSLAARPTELTWESIDVSDWSVDEVLRQFPADHPVIQEWLPRLEAHAQQFSQTRTIRQLAEPERVSLRYTGLPTTTEGGTATPSSLRGLVQLARDANGDFSTTFSNLKESISYRLQLGDYRTPARQIVLVPPPLLIEFRRAESWPAYRQRVAPLQEDRWDWQALKPWQQVQQPRDLPTTGERTTIVIPSGAELRLSGQADKPLREVRLNWKQGRPRSDSLDQVAPAADRFEILFVGADRLTTSAEFELTLADDDAVTSRRTVVIQVQDDAAPEVRVGIAVLREFNQGYLCTAKALIPFMKESIIRDDTGLSQVEFDYQLIRLESAVVQALQFEANLGQLALAPLLPQLGTLLGPMGLQHVASKLGQGEQKQSGRVPVRAMARALNLLPKRTSANLQTELLTPWPVEQPAEVVREVRLNLDADGFDLQDLGESLKTRGATFLADPTKGETQNRYRLELAILGTDTNVLQGPKMGKNLEVIRLWIVSEADLLAAITADEDTIAKRFDEALRRLKESQEKLGLLQETLRGPEVASQVLLSAKVRSEDLRQELEKSQEILEGVVRDFERLKLEVETNRCQPGVAQRYESVLLRPLGRILENEHRAALQAMESFRAPLEQNLRPDLPLQTAARTTLDDLIRKLEQLRRELGENLTESKLRDDLRRIIENQKSVSEALARVIQSSRVDLLAPKLLPVAPVEIKTGSRVKVVVGIDWGLFDKNELTLQIQANPASGLSFPSNVTIQDDQDRVEITVEAKGPPGKYELTVQPSPGKAIMIPVVVKD